MRIFHFVHDLHLVVAGLVVDVLLAPVREEHIELSLFRNKVQIPLEFQVETLPECFQGDLKQETNELIHLNQSETRARFDQPINERKTATVGSFLLPAPRVISSGSNQKNFFQHQYFDSHPRNVDTRPSKWIAFL